MGSIRYQVKQINNKRFSGEKPCYNISLLTSHNTNRDQLAYLMNSISSFSEGDVSGIIDNLALLIASELASGHTVTLDGLGTFSISAELVKPVDSAEEIDGKNIRLRKICFKPAPAFKRNVAEKVRFVRNVPVIKKLENK